MDSVCFLFFWNSIGRFYKNSHFVSGEMFVKWFFIKRIHQATLASGEVTEGFCCLFSVGRFIEAIRRLDRQTSFLQFVQFDVFPVITNPWVKNHFFCSFFNGCLENVVSISNIVYKRLVHEDFSEFESKLPDLHADSVDKRWDFQNKGNLKSFHNKKCGNIYTYWKWQTRSN